MSVRVNSGAITVAITLLLAISSVLFLTGCGTIDPDEKKFFYDSWNGRDLVPPMYERQVR